MPGLEGGDSNFDTHGGIASYLKVTGSIIRSLTQATFDYYVRYCLACCQPHQS